MSTATLRFRLPEEEHEFRRAMLGDLAIQTLWHMSTSTAVACHKARRREPRNGENLAADSRNDPRRTIGRMNVQVKAHCQR
jgi:hypothetical protein